MITGRCYCGETVYEYAGEVIFHAQCHCAECQVYTGGGPNYFMLGRRDAFRFTSGEPVTYTRTDLDQPVTRAFCPTCHTGVANFREEGTVVMKVGTLDDPSDYKGPAAAIYLCDKRAFHMVPEGLPGFERLPPRR